MKKLVLLILALVMSVTLAACSGGNYDENNAAMQAKVDQAVEMSEEIIAWYGDNGFLEGDSAEMIQAVVESLETQTEALKDAHQKNLDAGGYDDDLYAFKLEAIDKVIASLQTSQDSLMEYEALLETVQE